MRRKAALAFLLFVAVALLLGLLGMSAVGCKERPTSPPTRLSLPTATPVATAPTMPAPTTDASGQEGFELELVIDPPGAGFVAAIPPFGPYAPGTSVTLAVIPPRVPPYVFTEWTGDASGTERGVQVVMDGPKRVVARFRNPYITPTPSPEEE